MKIICLLASPHGLKGNTSGLLSHVIKGAEGEEALCETIVLRGDTVLPCLACDVCHKKGACIQKDSFREIREKIDNADGLILATPNYMSGVSAQLKAFMDRCCGIVHCMSFRGKYGAAVVTSGGGGDDAIISYLNYFLITTGAVPVGGVSAAMSAMPREGFSGDVREEAVLLGQRLVRAWKKGEVPEDVSSRSAEFCERMRSLISFRGEEWPYEYGFWKEHGGLQPGA